MKRTTLARLLECRRTRQPAVLAKYIDRGEEALFVAGADAFPGELAATCGQALASDRALTVTTPAGTVFLQPFNPSRRLAIVGAVHIAQHLAPMAMLCGFDVTVIDPRRAFVTAVRFPGVALSTDWPDAALAAFAPDRLSAVVTLSHDPKIDDPALLTALGSPAFYIAALGSRRTHAKRIERLGTAGAKGLERIHGPAGLAIGARSPSEIALAILAEMVAAHNAQA